MTLKGVPSSISPELLYVLAKMGHGDLLVIADSNFPSDSTASKTINRVPIRVNINSTADLLRDILTLIPLDTYSLTPVSVMDRVASDKERNLIVPAYESILSVINQDSDMDSDTTSNIFGLTYVDRFEFYEQAKHAFCVVQTADCTPYANIIISKGVP